jgi:hypothetical protein
MSTLTENITSREWTFGPTKSVTMHYTLVGTADDVAMRTELETVLASTYDGLKRDEIRMEPIVVDETAGTGTWRVEVRYVEFPPLTFPSTGESSFSFDTGGGTQHILVSKETVGADALDGYATNQHQAINVKTTGKNVTVDGCDITVPVYTFSETHYIDDDDVTQAYKITLFNLTGKVNSDAFRGFAAGEVLFLGASGSQRGSGDWEITFKFAASPNQAAVTIGTLSVAKRGWDYLWVRFAPDIDTNRVVAKPVEVFVERVYDYASFAGLGI